MEYVLLMFQSNRPKLNLLYIANIKVTQRVENNLYYIATTEELQQQPRRITMIPKAPGIVAQVLSSKNIFRISELNLVQNQELPEYSDV